MGCAMLGTAASCFPSDLQRDGNRLWYRSCMRQAAPAAHISSPFSDLSEILSHRQNLKVNSMQAYSVFQRDGFDFSVISEGQGPDLVVIGSSTYYARAISKALSHSFRLHFIDHRGFAPADRPVSEEDAALAVISDDLEWLRGQLGLKRFLVLGHSGHGYMAIDYATRHPEQVSGLVLVGLSPDLGATHQAMTEARFEAEASTARKARFAQDIEQLGSMIEQDPDRKFAHICCALQARRWADPTYDESWLWEGLTLHTPLFDHLWGKVFVTFDMATMAQAVACPTLLVMGTQDFSIAPIGSWDAVAERFKALTIKELAQSGHTPMLEEPEAFNHVLTEWVQTATQSPQAR